MPGGFQGRRRNAQPWTFVVPTSRARIEELARAVSVPENVLGAGLVVAVLVQGKGPVLFDAGRAAQSMLLAAWALGLASCPNGITDRELARTVLNADGGRGSGDRPLLRAAGAAPRRRAAHGRGMEWAGEPQADRRGRAMAVVTRMKGGLDLGGTKIQAVVTNGESMVLGKARRETPRKGGPEAVVFELAEALRAALDDAGVEPMGLAGIGVGAPGSIDVETGSVLQVANIEGWDAPFPLGPTLAEELGRPVRIGNDVNVAVDAEHRFGAGRGLDSFLGRVLGHGGRRWHRDGRPEAHGPWLGRRDRARLLEARRPPLQLWPRGLRRGIRRPLGARGASPRARQGAPDGAVRADGEARARPAHERRLAARAAGRRRARGGARCSAPSRRSASGSARR